jgi:hypothetical protein
VSAWHVTGAEPQDRDFLGPALACLGQAGMHRVHFVVFYANHEPPPVAAMHAFKIGPVEVGLRTVLARVGRSFIYFPRSATIYFRGRGTGSGGDRACFLSMEWNSAQSSKRYRKPALGVTTWLRPLILNIRRGPNLESIQPGPAPPCAWAPSAFFPSEDLFLDPFPRGLHRGILKVIWRSLWENPVPVGSCDWVRCRMRTPFMPKSNDRLLPSVPPKSFPFSLMVRHLRVQAHDDDLTPWGCISRIGIFCATERVDSSAEGQGGQPSCGN